MKKYISFFLKYVPYFFVTLLITTDLVLLIADLYGYIENVFLDGFEYWGEGVGGHPPPYGWAHQSKIHYTLFMLVTYIPQAFCFVKGYFLLRKRKKIAILLLFVPILFVLSIFIWGDFMFGTPK